MRNERDGHTCEMEADEVVSAALLLILFILDTPTHKQVQSWLRTSKDLRRKHGDFSTGVKACYNKKRALF